MVKTMTTLLSPTEVGKYFLISTAIAFFAMLLINPINMLFNRRVHTWLESEKLASQLVLYVFFILIIATLSLPVTLGVITFFGIASEQEYLHFSTIYIGSIIFGTFVQMIIFLLNLLGENKVFTYISISFSTLNLISALFMVKFLGNTAGSWLLGQVFSQVIFSFIAGFIFIKVFSLRLTFENIRNSIPNIIQIKQTLIFSLPIGITATLGWIQFQGYRFLISDMSGLQEFGLFAAGYGLAASLLAAVEQILSAWFQPLFYRSSSSSSEEQRAAAWSTYLNAMLPIATLAVCTIAIASSNLVPIFLGAAFSQSVPYVAAGAFAELGRVYLGAFMMRGHQVMNTRILIRPIFYSVVVSMGILLSTQTKGDLTLVPVGIFAGAILGCFMIYKKRLDKSIVNLEFSKFFANLIYVIPMLMLIYYFDTTSTDTSITKNIGWLLIKLSAALPILIWLMKDYLPNHLRNKL